jgi:parallel beta-helix repeat protein
MTRTLSLVVLLFLSSALFAQSDAISFTLGPIERIGTSDIANSFGTLHNQGAVNIPNVTIQVNLMNAPLTTFIGAESDASLTCRNDETPYRLICVAPLIRSGETLRLQVYVGPVRESRVLLSGQATWNSFEATWHTPNSLQTKSFGREVVVTSTGDRGAGSLRAAIEYANDTCARDAVPCRIVFHIAAPVPQSGWFTIYPNTPLPALTGADIEIDGTTQSQFSGDTNTRGPEIALNGGATGIGHGLELAGEGIAVVKGLAIGGFPWDGIAVTRRSFARSFISGNYIGTDPTGTHAVPNGSRGITFDPPAAEFDVTQNIISGNGRSGVFLAGASSITLEANTIGAGVGGVPIPNGAAGVVIGPPAAFTVLRRNTIVHNTQFGIAIAPEVNRYELIDNSISRNGLIGIDRGLDGFSGYDSNEQDVYAAKIPPPRLVSASYEPRNNETTIVGTYGNDFDAWGTWAITLFRSSVNDGQGEVVVGHTVARNGTFRFFVPGDLTGQFITATGHRRVFLGLSGDWYWTSEFSESVVVSR